MRKILIFIVLVALVAGFFGLGLYEYFTLSYFKEQQAEFVGLYEANPVVVLGAYALIYVGVVGAGLPGATVLTLLAGALFGFVTAVVLVSLVSAIGATIACALARFLFHDAVQGRFGERMKAFNAGFKREGAFYLFALRLVPLFPFFIINLVMGFLPSTSHNK